MSATTPSQSTTSAVSATASTSGVTSPLDSASTARGRRRRTVVISAVVFLVAAVAAYLIVSDPFAGSPTSGALDNADPAALATVTQEPLSSQTQVAATLGYTGSYSVVNEGQGHLTWLPDVGAVISQGQTLYDVDGSPVVLLYGSTPAYRTLAEGASASDVTGVDVRNLNDDLVALGYITSAELNGEPADFGYWTKVGVEALQKALGETQNGTLTLGQVVFLPSATRITALGPNTILGSTAPPDTAILTATSTSRVVTIALDAGQQGQVAIGDPVTITLPNNQTTPGKVTLVGTVATTPSNDGAGSSSPTVTVLVTPDDPKATGSIDQAPVEVSITTASVKSALVVPVNSLLALASGGYAIEVVGAKGVHTLVPVTTGLFDDADGVVAVSGPGVIAGERIVVPAT
jgi:hypothetical protein